MANAKAKSAEKVIAEAKAQNRKDLALSCRILNLAKKARILYNGLILSKAVFLWSSPAL